jgi:hypothetical protein
VGESFAELVSDSAKLSRIPSVGTVSSWDNLTIKGLLRDKFDKYIVWGEGKLDEAVELHSVPIEKIKVVGPYPFVYIDKSMGARTKGLGNSYVLWLTSSTFITNGVQNEWLLIEEFVIYCLGAGEIEILDKLLIRLHPQTPGGKNAFLSWIETRNHLIQESIKTTQVTCEFTETVMQRDAYLQQISGSACSISLATTAGVESWLCGVPLVSPPGDLTKRSFDNFKHGKLLDSDYGGPIKRSNSWEEFISFLKNPINQNVSNEFSRYFGLNLNIKKSTELFANEILN